MTSTNDAHNHANQLRHYTLTPLSECQMWTVDDDDGKRGSGLSSQAQSPMNVTSRGQFMTAQEGKEGKKEKEGK